MFVGEHSKFVGQIEKMNQMYRLQVTNVPTLSFVDNRKDGSQETVPASVRLHRFKNTMLEELSEIDEIIELADAIETSPDRQSDPMDVLVKVADVLADMIVFCASESRKFGIPLATVMNIVMESNMSKLNPDGSASYDEKGKFLKGPNYWPPEPKLRELLVGVLDNREIEITPKVPVVVEAQ